MNKLKIIFYITLFLLFSNSSFGQIIKARSTSVAFTSRVNETSWSDWSEFEEASVLIVLDVERERITIYSKEKQIFDIIEVQEVTTDDDGDDFWPLLCVDVDGITCTVNFAKLNSRDGANQIYIEYKDFNYVYNVYFIDD